MGEAGKKGERPEGKEEETEVRDMGKKPGSDGDNLLSLGITLTDECIPPFLHLAR